MTELTAPIHRTSTATRRERGRVRNIVTMMVPPAFVGFRLAGDRRAFLLDIEVAYELAVHQFTRDVERLAKRIAKDEGIRIGTARARAYKQIAADTRGIIGDAKEKARTARRQRQEAQTIGPAPARGKGKCPAWTHRHVDEKRICRRSNA